MKRAATKNEECKFVNLLLGGDREPDDNCCYTQGVKCDKDNHIQEIDLSDKKLSKEIPEFGNMPYLERLNLGGNNLTGKIPSDIKNLSKLIFLYLNNNELEGEIPSSLFELPELIEVWLNANNFEGNIPSTVSKATKLMKLKLSYNNLSGVIPTSGLESLSMLNIITLDNNSDLVGRVPTSARYTECNFENTSLCYETKDKINNSKCKFPKQHDCTTCVKNASKVDGICQCKENFIGAGYDVCYPESNEKENECEFINKLLKRNATNNCCKESGVTCSFGHIKKIALNNYGIKATMPDSFGSMPYIEQLLLNNNEIKGIVPDVSGLKSLSQINLSTNKLNGLLPTESFEKLTGLENISLHSNSELYGRVPNTAVYKTLNLCSFVKTNLCYTKSETDKQCDYPEEKSCTECVENAEVVEDICKCNNNGIGPGYIQCFSANTSSDTECSFVNKLLNKDESNDCCSEDGIECYYDHIISIDLKSKNLSGQFPTSIGSIPYLTTLDLSLNQLTGSIPKDINELTSLTALKLNNNQLSGDFPSDLKKLTNLTELILHNNTFSGEISFIEGLVNLEELHIGGNEFKGNIPTSIGTLTKLKLLNLSENKFNGKIPTDELAKLTNLEYIYLDKNADLSGKIPDTTKLQLLKGCSFVNTKLCNLKDSSNEICTYPENQICNSCKENATVVGDVCECNENYSGLGYINCEKVETVGDNELNTDTNSGFEGFSSMNVKSLFRLTYLTIIVIILGML